MAIAARPISRTPCITVRELAAAVNTTIKITGPRPGIIAIVDRPIARPTAKLARILVNTATVADDGIITRFNPGVVNMTMPSTVSITLFPVEMYGSSVLGRTALLLQSLQ
jgi:hypothetical protein